jgi:hypothetical protein
VAKIELVVGDYTFLEPMAFILNWVMMLQCFYYFKKLRQWRISYYSIFWRWFFLFFGISALFGGLSHLLFAYSGLTGKIPGWICGIIAVSSMEMAMVYSMEQKNRLKIQIIIVFKLIASLILLSYYFDFDVVIIHSVGMAFFIVIPFLIYLREKKYNLNFMFYGLVMLIAALPARIMQYDFHIWFNRDDVGHVFMMFALFLFHNGVIVFERENKLEQLQTAHINS